MRYSRGHDRHILASHFFPFFISTPIYTHTFSQHSSAWCEFGFLFQKMMFQCAVCMQYIYFFASRKYGGPPAAWDSARLLCRICIYPNQNLDVNKRDSFLQKNKTTPKQNEKTIHNTQNWPFKSTPPLHFTVDC